MLSGSNGLFVFITATNTLNAKLTEKSIITFFKAESACMYFHCGKYSRLIYYCQPFCSLFMRVDALRFPLLLSSILPDLGRGERGEPRLCHIQVSGTNQPTANELAWDRNNRTNLGGILREGASICGQLVGLYKALQMHKNLQISGKTWCGCSVKITAEIKPETLLQGPKATS